MIIMLLVLSIIFNSLSGSFVYSAQGIIMSYKAPVYERPDKKSRIFTSLKRGEKIYIHNNHLINRYEWYRKVKNLDYYKESFGLSSFANTKISRDSMLKEAKYLKIMLKQGIIGYIPSNLVYFYYEDYREKNQVLIQIQNDLTDDRPSN